MSTTRNFALAEMALDARSCALGTFGWAPVEILIAIGTVTASDTPVYLVSGMDGLAASVGAFDLLARAVSGVDALASSVTGADGLAFSVSGQDGQ